ncbi:MAG TPA: hypothetical protein VN253_25460 [Kofleriaceae bacterium]|nr:hypothetical protein [Kofleriaceae bacterium]
MQDNSNKSLRREIEARPAMKRAVSTMPGDDWFFPHAHDLLVRALARGAQQEDLLIVMQPVRLSIERYAVRAGLSPADVAETGPKHNTSRCGHFEYDLVHDYLPTYLERVGSRETDVCFRLHARSAYRDMLRQRIRRELRRAELWREAPEDARSRQELAVQGADDADTIVVGATHFAQWVPSPDEVHDGHSLARELAGMLDPLDYRVAELLMAHPIVQGDKSEIARLLGASEGRNISQGRVTRAIANIAVVLDRVRRQRGLRRW